MWFGCEGEKAYLPYPIVFGLIVVIPSPLLLRRDAGMAAWGENLALFAD